MAQKGRLVVKTPGRAERIRRLGQEVLGDPDWKPSSGGARPPGVPPGDSSQSIDHLEMARAVDRSPYSQALRKRLTFDFDPATGKMLPAEPAA